MTSLSVFMIVKNEEKNLIKVLPNLVKIADEIIMVDSGSTDQTIIVAEEHGAIVYERAFDNFTNQKNYAMDLCRSEWLLSIDADELVDDQLAESITEAVKGSKDTAYNIKREVYCFGKRIKYGGWGNDKVVRLFPRGEAQFEGDVHEKLQHNLQIKDLPGTAEHYTYTDMHDYLERYNRYTDLGAKELFKAGKFKSNSYFYISILYRFVKLYIFKRGFLDGVEGLLLAVFSSTYGAVKHFKALELKKNNVTKRNSR